MPTNHTICIKKYRITIEELRTVEVRPTYDEENPTAVDQDWKKPQTYREDRWDETDKVELTDNTVVAGFLKAKAEYFAPPKKIVRGL